MLMSSFVATVAQLGQVQFTQSVEALHVFSAEKEM
jgi:hypothetical protein